MVYWDLRADKDDMRKTVISLAVLGCLLALPAKAAADVTAFLGVSPTPASRSSKGFAIGLNLFVVGFEFEYAHTSEDATEGAPSLRTGMLNGLVQTPTSQVQLYLTAGGGFFRETLEDDSTTNFGTNIGGGVKFRLAGPLRARVDYRVFHLRGNPLYANPQRIYAGLNLSF